MKSQYTAEDDESTLMTVNIYDTHSATTILKVNAETRACDICKAIAHKFDVGSDNAKFHSLVLVVTAFNSVSKFKTHCVRTLAQTECPLEIRGALISKLIDKYNIADSKEVADSVRWYYKDIRTSPIEFGDAGEVSGEYSSDDEEEISHSDLAYLAKAERKGYLLKRSSKDQNLWRRWYCALTDHLWCVDINRDDPRAICIKLSGMIRYKQGNHSTLDQVQTIIINSLKQTHFFRAFNVIEHRKWMEDLYVKTNYATDNDYFSMAEVIICDEELTKSKRMHKQVQDILDMNSVFQCLAENKVFTGPQLAMGVDGCTLPARGTATTSSSGFVTPIKSGHSSSNSLKRLDIINPTTLITNINNNNINNGSESVSGVDDLMNDSLIYNEANSEEFLADRAVNSKAYESLRSSEAHTPVSRSTGSFASVVNSTNTAVDIAFNVGGTLQAARDELNNITNGNSENNSTTYSHYNSSNNEEERGGETLTASSSHSSIFNALSPFSPPPVTPYTPVTPAVGVIMNPMDRSRKHSLIHGFHHRNKLLFKMISFMLEVQYFKELFRHDLVVTSDEQYERAALLHSRYIVPQLLAVGLSLGTKFIAQYANRMTATPLKRKVSSNSISIKANGNIVISSQASGRSNSKVKGRSPVGSFGEEAASTRSYKTAQSGRNSPLRNGINNNNNNGSSGDLASESAKVGVRWGMNTQSLLKIHILLYDSHEISASDIENYQLSEFVSKLHPLRAAQGVGEEELTSESRNNQMITRKTPAEAAAPVVAAPSFWSGLFSSPTHNSNNSNSHNSSSSSMPKIETSKEALAAADLPPVSADLFDEAVAQLLEVIQRG